MKENKRKTDKGRIFPADPDKTYGLMAVVKGESPQVEKEPEDTVMTYPHLLFREAIAAMLLVIFLTVISLYFDAPLEEMANPGKTPNPAKAPWYFLNLQELLHYFSPFVAGVLIPGLVVVGLMAIPYIDPKRKGIGVWFSPDRKLANILFAIFVITVIVLTVIGTFFRGPGWIWVWPWQTGVYF